MVKRILQYFRRETVLSAALVCALLSFLLTPPSVIHLQGIDTTTLLMLFSLMTIVAGFRRMCALDAVSRKLTRRVTTLRGLSAVMVALCFALSMLVTNDVALLTLVPLTLLLFRAGGQKSTIWTVVLETVAANLGSMVTPIGNPQNLYLYTSGRLTALDFLTLLAPYAAVALALLLALCLLLPKERVAVDTSARAPLARKMLTLYGALSALALLAATGCDGVAVGRGAMGNPWLFGQIAAAMECREVPPPPSLHERFRVLLRHIYDMCEDKGEYIAMQQARTHAAWYMHGLRGAATLRRECCGMLHFTDLDRVIAEDGAQPGCGPPAESSSSVQS